MMVTKDMKCKQKINHAVNKANRMLVILKRTFESRDLFLRKNIYVSLIRPHLEYIVQACNPNLIGDIDKLETIQKRALKNPEGFGDSTIYRDNFCELNLTLIKGRRTRGDLIKIFKVQKSFEKIALVKSPLLIEHTGPASDVRGIALILHRESFKARLSNDFSQSVSVRHNFFLNKMVPVWNSLTGNFVSSLTVNSFKNA